MLAYEGLSMPRRPRPVWIFAVITAIQLVAIGWKLYFAYQLSRFTGGFGAAVQLATGVIEPGASYSGTQLITANFIADAMFHSLAAFFFAGLYLVARGYESEIQALASSRGSADSGPGTQAP